MKRSLNQIEQTARKAARGAGYAWGLAFDAGRAVRWLHAYGLNGAPALAAHLQARGAAPAAPAALSGVWRAAAGALDPLATGASMSDCLDAMRRGGRGLETAAIAYPLLAAGFIGCAAESEDAAFELTWRGCVLRCARGRVRIEGAAVEAEVAPGLRCRPCAANFRGRAPRIGGTVAAGAWAILERHARRTHVAATSASRRTGAGAGLSDND